MGTMVPAVENVDTDYFILRHPYYNIDTNSLSGFIVIMTLQPQYWHVKSRQEYVTDDIDFSVQPQRHGHSLLQLDLLPYLQACSYILAWSDWLVVYDCRVDHAMGMKGFFFSWLTFQGVPLPRSSYPTLKEWGVPLHLCSPMNWF